MRSLRARPAAPPPPPPPAPEPHPLDPLLSRLGLPGVVARQFLADFQDLRPLWPILIPVMVWVAVSTYRRERALALAERLAARQQK